MAADSQSLKRLCTEHARCAIAPAARNSPVPYPHVRSGRARVRRASLIQGSLFVTVVKQAQRFVRVVKQAQRFVNLKGY